MIEQPTVCAVMLTRDRPELAAKAVECFRQQTYPNKRLIVWNTGEPFRINFPFDAAIDPNVWFPDVDATAFTGMSIGELRNTANRFAADHYVQSSTRCEILIHFDDDDWSHPNRITEQVALLQASGADVVGYSEMLFWRTLEDRSVVPGRVFTNEQAWLFQCAKQLTPAVGTSLCYWRKTWERTKFADLPRGPGGQSEYREFLMRNKVETCSPMYIGDELTGTADDGIAEPRMIARIHGANFSPYNIEEQIARGSNAMPNEGWTRLPDWDARVREILG